MSYTPFFIFNEITMKSIINVFARTLLIVGFCWLFAGLAHATTYYVSTAGNNTNPGTSNTTTGAWRTIAFACKSTVLRPGDVISIGSGTFTETEVCKIPCGVSVFGAGNNATFIKSSASPLFLLENCQSTTNRQEIAQFKLDGQGKAAGLTGMEVSRVYGVSIHDIIIEDFKGTLAGGGLNLTYATNSSLSKSTLKNNADTTAAECGGNLGLAELDNCYFYDLTIEATTGYAVKNGLSTQNVIQNSSFFNNTFEVKTNRCAQWNTLAVELHIIHCENVKFFNCLFNNTLSISESATQKGFFIYNNHFNIPASLGAGYAIEATSSYMNIHHNYFEGGLYGLGNWHDRASNKGLLLHHNVFDKQFADIDIMHVPAGLTESRFYNNTMVTRNRLIEYFDLNVDSGKPVSEVDIRNNIFMATSALPSGMGNTGNSTFTKNVFFNAESRGTQIITGDPKLPLNSSFPAQYVPATGSSAINAGLSIPGITDGSVGTPDLGAFEVGKNPWTVGVNSNPVAVARVFASKLSGAVPLTVNFDGTKSLGSNLTYKWTLANGQSPTGSTASATYSTAGTYRVSLVVTGSGVTDTTFVTISATNGAPGNVIDGAVYELQPQNATTLRLNASASANKTFINVATANNSSGQQWKFVNKGPGIYELIPQNAGGLRLDIPYASNAAGAAVQIYTTSNKANQRWYVFPIGNDIYELEVQCSPGKRLDVKGGGASVSGTSVQIWNPNSTSAQRWKLILKSTPGGRTAADLFVSPEQSSVSVYPNPGTGGEIYVEAVGISEARVELRNMQGMAIPFQKQVVSERQLRLVPQAVLSAGMYLVTVDILNQTTTRKVLIR